MQCGLKRDFLIKNIIQASGIGKKSDLLVELVKWHFPIKMNEIENTRNEEYQKKREIIQEQMIRIKSKKEPVLEVA